MTAITIASHSFLKCFKTSPLDRYAVPTPIIIESTMLKIDILLFDLFISIAIFTPTAKKAVNNISCSVLFSGVILTLK